MRQQEERKLFAVRRVLNGELTKLEAATELERTVRTVERHLTRFMEQGPEVLRGVHGPELATMRKLLTDFSPLLFGTQSKLCYYICSRGPLGRLFLCAT